MDELAVWFFYTGVSIILAVIIYDLCCALFIRKWGESSRWDKLLKKLFGKR